MLSGGVEPLHVPLGSTHRLLPTAARTVDVKFTWSPGQTTGGHETTPPLTWHVRFWVLTGEENRKAVMQVLSMYMYIYKI